MTRSLVVAATMWIALSSSFASAQTAQPSASPSPPASSGASPALPVFIPPKGWQRFSLSSATPPGVSILGRWHAPHTGDNISVVSTSDGGLDLEHYVALNLQSYKAKFGAVPVAHNHPVCGGGSAQIVRVKYGGASIVQVYAVSGIIGYIATYAHDSSRPEDPAALRALDMLCVPQSVSPSDSVPFSAPSSWKRVDPSAMPFPAEMRDAVLGVWIGPYVEAKGASLDMLMKGPPLTAATIQEQSIEMSSYMKTKFGFTMRTSTPQKLCGRLDGWYESMDGVINGHALALEVTFLPFEHAAYIAMYMRPATLPEDPAARASLNTLCPEEPAQST